MSTFEEHLFGRIAVLNGFLTMDQLQECLTAQRSATSSNRLQIGEILLSKGYLTKEQLGNILDIRRKKLRMMLRDSNELVRTEKVFGQLALRKGLVTLDRLETALLEQQRLARMNLHISVGEILVALKFMKVDEVLEILSVQNKRILVCPYCDSHFTVIGYHGEKNYECRQCEQALDVPGFLETIATDGVIDDSDVVRAGDLFADQTLSFVTDSSGESS
jgi:hypothetical protein